MRASSMKYLTKTGLKSLWINKLMTVASVGTLMACMLIIGVAVMLSVNVNHTLQGIEEQNVIMCYFNDENSVRYGSAEPLCEYNAKGAIPKEAYLIHNEEEAKKVCDEIAALDNVVDVTYISKEDSLAAIEENYLSGQDACIEVLHEDSTSNPMSDGARVTVSDMGVYSETAKNILAVTGVTTIQAQADIAEKIDGISNALKTAGIWIIAVLMIIALVIVCNTIRVTMYNRKLEISIMKAVGATNAFVRLPFVIEGVAIGLISAVLSFGIVYLMHSAIADTITRVLTLTGIVPFREYAWFLLAIFVIIGIVSGLFGSVFMMGKYLKKEGSEFRAL